MGILALLARSKAGVAFAALNAAFALFEAMGAALAWDQRLAVSGLIGVLYRFCSRRLVSAALAAPIAALLLRDVLTSESSCGVPLGEVSVLFLRGLSTVVVAVAVAAALIGGRTRILEFPLAVFSVLGLARLAVAPGSAQLGLVFLDASGWYFGIAALLVLLAVLAGVMPAVATEWMGRGMTAASLAIVCAGSACPADIRSLLLFGLISSVLAAAPGR